MGSCGAIYTLITAPEMRWKTPSSMAIPYQGLLKFLTFIIQYKPIHENCINFLYSVYSACDKKPDQNYETKELRLINHWALKFKLLFKVLTCSLTFIVITDHVVYPLVMNVIFDRNEFPAPIYLPYLDHEVFFDRVILWVCHLLMILSVYFGFIGADIMIVMISLHVCPLTLIIGIKLRRLGAALRRHPNIASRSATKAYLRNIIQMHQEFVAFISGVSKLFYYVFIMDILSNFVSMVLALFGVLYLTWFPMYLMFCMFMGKTFLLCMLGTVVQHYVRYWVAAC